MDFTALAAQVLNGGGFTVSTKPGREVPDRGYMVSIEGFEVKIRNVFHVEQLAPYLADYCSRFERALQAPGAYFGAWLDGQTVYLDVSSWYEFCDTARVAAWENRQQAFYSLEASQTIRTKRRVD
jgi:hypothetical protein